MKLFKNCLVFLLACMFALSLFPLSALGAEAEKTSSATAPVSGELSALTDPTGLSFAAAFPDANFCAYVMSITDASDPTELISAAQANTIATALTVSVESSNISSLAGIEYFTAMTDLYCYENSLTTLDLNANTALLYLECNDNLLTTLDLSANIALGYLDCYNNTLTSLDVSTNTALTHLACDHNTLTTLDLSANTVLETLYCDNNALASLDVSANTVLETLSCGTNSLTFLDVSANTALKGIVCSENALLSITGLDSLSLFGFTADNQAVTVPVVPSSGAYAFESDTTYPLAPGFDLVFTDSAVSYDGTSQLFLTGSLTDSDFTSTHSASTHALNGTISFVLATYTVEFVDWDGTVLDTQTVAYGQQAMAPQTPTRTGYTFSGWSTTFTNITQNTTITAHYTQNTPTPWTPGSATPGTQSTVLPATGDIAVGFAFFGVAALLLWAGSALSVRSVRKIRSIL